MVPRDSSGIPHLKIDLRKKYARNPMENTNNPLGATTAVLRLIRTDSTYDVTIAIQRIIVYFRSIPTQIKRECTCCGTLVGLQVW